MKFGDTHVVTFVPNVPLWVIPVFAKRFNASWVPNKLTLILLNLTSADEGEYRCEVITLGRWAQTWIRKIQVSLVGKLRQLQNRILIKGCYF